MKLQKLVEAKLSLEGIARELGMSPDSIRQKMRRLGLVEEDKSRLQPSSSSRVTIHLPKELFTVEQVLLSLAQAVKELESPGLEKDETLVCVALFRRAEFIRTSLLST